VNWPPGVFAQAELLKLQKSGQFPDEPVLLVQIAQEKQVKLLKIDFQREHISARLPFGSSPGDLLGIRLSARLGLYRTDTHV
jgi:hypothetical protein